MIVNPRRKRDCIKKGNIILSIFLALYDGHLQSPNKHYRITRKLPFNYIRRIEVGKVGWFGEQSPHVL